MAKWGELSDFTYSELSALKWEDLSLQLDKLISKIENENIHISYPAYKKLCQLCDTINQSTPFNIPRPYFETSSVVKVLKKIATLYSDIKSCVKFLVFLYQIINDIMSE